MAIVFRQTSQLSERLGQILNELQHVKQKKGRKIAALLHRSAKA
jgi:hypothetical protein